MYERCALLAVGRGETADARRWAEEAIARGKTTGSAWDRLEATRALGVARLLAREPDLLAEALPQVWAHTEREGVDDPGSSPRRPTWSRRSSTSAGSSRPRRWPAPRRARECAGSPLGALR